MPILIAPSQFQNVQTFIGTPLDGDPAGTSPRRVLGFLVDFSAGGTITGDLNLQAQLAQSQIPFIQSIKIDNTLNAAQVDVTFVGSSDHIRVPPNSIAVAQVHVSNPPILHISCSGGTGATLFFVTNVFMNPTIASTVSVTSPFIFNSNGYALVADPVVDGAVTAGIMQVNMAALAAIITGGKLSVADSILDGTVSAGAIATTNAAIAAIISGGKLSVADAIVDGAVTAGIMQVNMAALAAIITGGKLSVADSILDGTVTAGAVATTNAVLASIISGGALTVVQQAQGGTPTSRSLVTVAAASTQLMAANAARKYFKIAAPQTQGIWLNFLGGAAGPNLADSYFLGQAQIWETSVPQYINRAQINYYSTAAGLEIAAEEA